MSFTRSTGHSPYMEFAKLNTTSRYNLATSGVMNYPLTALPVRLQDLEINGPTIYGYGPLQERLARKSDVSADCVVAATGTSMANHLAMAATFEPGDEVLIEEPTYELLLSTARYLAASIRRFPRRFEEDFRVDPYAVEKAITSRTRLVVLTNLHNPSGALTDSETLAAVGEIARKAGARVLVDEVYLESLFDAGTRSAFHLGDHFVTTNSLTKAYGLSGLRCGWILAEPALAKRIWRLNDLFAATPAHPAELLSVIALDHLQDIAVRSRTLLDANRKLLYAFLDIQPRLKCFRPAFGTVAFPSLSTGSVDKFCDFLRERYDTCVVPGRFFEMPQHFRIGIGGSTEITSEGLKRLSFALREFTKT
jgi:aspartate/methionine/tyrosine aminotransferase